MIKKLIVVLILICFTFSNFGLSETVRDESEQINFCELKDKWTVMYYICCDSKEMEEYAKPLIENLSKIGSTENMNLIALYDSKPNNDSRMYYINNSGEKINLNDIFGWPKEVDMSNSNTLELFYKNIRKRYPAEHYALITYADGGTGWQEYPLGDEDGKGYLTIPDFARCLKKITDDGKIKLDVLQTSCCMSNVELAYEFSSYIDYLITTQEHISKQHWVKRFYQPVWSLRNDTSMTPKSFSKTAALQHEPHTFQMHESYMNWSFPLAKILDNLPFPQLHMVQCHSSVTIVNLSRINKLKKSIQNLTQFLILHLNDEEMINSIEKARRETREYGKGAWACFIPRGFAWIYNFLLPIEILSYKCRIDLYHFVKLLEKNVDNIHMKKYCNAVMNSINENVVMIKKIEGDPSHGLNIYFPRSKRSYNKKIGHGELHCPYEKLKFTQDTLWDEFLKSYFRSSQ